MAVMMVYLMAHLTVDERVVVKADLMVDKRAGLMVGLMVDWWVQT